MIKVVSFKICPFVQRVTALLEAKQIPYEIEFIQLSDKPQWFLDISPNGQVPILITESGMVLFESDAIVEYLDEIAPPVEADVSPEQRAIDRAWGYQAAKHYLVQCGAMRSADKETWVQRTANLAKAFAKAEKALGNGPYFKGAAISNVDIAWLPLLHRAHIIREHTCCDFLARYLKVKAWQSAMMATGLASKSVSNDFEAAFTGFYLSEKTFLGGCKNSPNSLDSDCSVGTCC
ncbi:glutathione S-transferase family protein [Leptothoe spongobia]|uniref:Glutathione S-transferase family protein n=1 Tax=Leptothoe spongobia TAU-MAC 1115 TaxID=1967444 RepID=A0A947DIW5_9CYAN|nr:glutathione S-transferase family protein [Leptothoe spongobia]MBT9317840.1 glutathione S-transferase family protein [Leptothoe spongobia TAU-MAC 1115]